jgi:hypothetical protein
MTPDRHCRTCDVAWSSSWSRTCWHKGCKGDTGSLYVTTGPNVAAGWPVDNIEDFVWGVW